MFYEEKPGKNNTMVVGIIRKVTKSIKKVSFADAVAWCWNFVHNVKQMFYVFTIIIGAIMVLWTTSEKPMNKFPAIPNDSSIQQPKNMTFASEPPVDKSPVIPSELSIVQQHTEYLRHTHEEKHALENEMIAQPPDMILLLQLGVLDNLDKNSAEDLGTDLLNDKTGIKGAAHSNH